MTVLAAILARLWQHGKSSECGIAEKLAILAIAALIVRAVVKIGVTR